MVEEDGVGGAGNGGLHVGIVEDDVGRLAAQLQRNLLQIAGSGLQNQLAHFGRAGEGDLVHVRMRGQRSAGGLAVAGNDIDYAFGECRLRR